MFLTQKSVSPLDVCWTFSRGEISSSSDELPVYEAVCANKKINNYNPSFICKHSSSVCKLVGCMVVVEVRTCATMHATTFWKTIRVFKLLLFLCSTERGAIDRITLFNDDALSSRAGHVCLTVDKVKLSRNDSRRKGNVVSVSFDRLR